MTEPQNAHYVVLPSEVEDEDDVTATVAKINQCYQDHVNAFRSCSACFMLSDSEYSDFGESNGDKKWKEYQQDYSEYRRMLEKCAGTDIHIVTDKEESDVEEQEVGVLSLRHPADVFHLESDVEDEASDLPPLTAAQLQQMWEYALPRGTARTPLTTPRVM